jgi:uncharacterized protein (DUF1330 family)
MPAYIVGEIHITDPVAYRAHVPVALATVARFGGRVVAGGGKIELLDGGPMRSGSWSSSSRMPKPPVGGIAPMITKPH